MAQSHEYSGVRALSKSLAIGQEPFVLSVQFYYTTHSELVNGYGDSKSITGMILGTKLIQMECSSSSVLLPFHKMLYSGPIAYTAEAALFTYICDQRSPYPQTQGLHRFGFENDTF